MVKKLGLKLKEQKGFTLIELLAVIVILGIIAAIAIPAISNVISKSQAKADAQEKLQVINAARMVISNVDTEKVDTSKDGFYQVSELKSAGYLDRSELPDANYVKYDDGKATGSTKGYYFNDGTNTTSEETILNIANGK
ncbi:prepilin-type N-terminal cleavage/methylation domain-containing protein [Neobacillus mesonae]|uniref:prepilin-type N-terminal cleavage/methylation domain-containing protein n=1 Tax=Neobacillus mesonae TaxID=1193713 RepID=UPI002E1CBDEC|nr:prepilin-type N-terminal cleavage/methylation domain-containing protein [Neobacillus mesonae]